MEVISYRHKVDRILKYKDLEARTGFEDFIRKLREKGIICGEVNVDDFVISWDGYSSPSGNYMLWRAFRETD